MRRIFVLLFWTAVVVVLVMASLPKPPPIPLDPDDKVLHIIAFVALSGLGVLAYPATLLAILFLGLSLFGGLIELVQSIPGVNRDASLADWMADALAVAAVFLPVAAIRRWRREAYCPLLPLCFTRAAGSKRLDSITDVHRHGYRVRADCHRCKRTVILDPFPILARCHARKWLSA